MKIFLIFISFIFYFIFSIKGQSNWVHYNTSNSGLLTNVLVGIISDKSGNLWVAIGGGFIYPSGLMKYNGNSWTFYNTLNSGLPSNYIRALAIDTSNVLWIGTSAGLVKFDGINWTVYNSSNSGLPNNQPINVLTIDKNNGIWVGSYLNYICYFYNNIWHNITPAEYPIPGLCINTIAIDDVNKVWMGFDCNDGIAVLNPNDSTWVFHTTANGLQSNYVSSLVQDKLGNIWAGYSGFGFGGLSKYDGNNWTTHTPFQSVGTWTSYHSIIVDSLNNLWVGTKCEGLYKYDGSSWTNYGAPLPNNECSALQGISIDVNNRLWFAAHLSGIWRADLPIGIEENIVEKEIAIYPNPASTLLHIITDKNLNNEKFKIYDEIGKEIKIIAYRQNSKSFKLDISTLKNGLYFLTHSQLHNGIKFIIQR